MGLQFPNGAAVGAVADLILAGSISGFLTHTVPAIVTTHTLIWPSAQSTGAQVLQNDGSGNLSWVSVGGAQDLAATLATGFITGANDIEINTGRFLQFARGNLLKLDAITQTVGDGTAQVPDLANAVDQFVMEDVVQVLTNKTLTTPSIASFINANHDHSDPANGGLLSVVGVHTLGGASHSVDLLANLNALISDATLIDTGDSRLSDDRFPTAHNLAGAQHNADTLANLNAKISDALLLTNQSAEISAITEKTVLVNADLLVIEDSEATNAKKRVQISNLPAGAPSPHDIGGAQHLSDTLANLNTKISDAVLLGSTDPIIINKEAFFEADFGSNFGDYRSRTIGNTASFRFTFNVPGDFNALISLELIGVPNDAATKTIDLDSDYSGDGEDAQLHSESGSVGPTTVANQKIAIDISGVFASLAAGDSCGLFVQHVSSTPSVTIQYLGIRLRYSS